MVSKEPAREARESTWREGRGSTLDKGLRDDLMRIFLQLDEDGDGVLNQKESAATKQLVALACGKDERARGVSVKQALGDAQGRADDFMSYVVAVSKQSQIPVPEILKRMNQALMLARRPSKFDESVNELRQLGGHLPSVSFCFIWFHDVSLVVLKMYEGSGALIILNPHFLG